MRKITLTNHPSNIAVFNADGMDKAIIMASDAIDQAPIRGAVWLSNHTSINWQLEKALRDSRPFGAFLQASRPKREIGTSSLSWDGKVSVSPDLIDDVRLSNLLILNRTFNKVALHLAHERSGETNPHYDRIGINGEDRESPLFSGMALRIICARTRQGTLVYDKTEEAKSGQPFPDPWQVPRGAHLFFVPNSSLGKVLWHSKPDFLSLPLQRPRVLDVYDCTHR